MDEQRERRTLPRLPPPLANRRAGPRHRCERGDGDRVVRLKSGGLEWPDTRTENHVLRFCQDLDNP